MEIDKNDFLFICGPCAVESLDQMNLILNLDFKPKYIRGGIYKLRTSKNTFQGLGYEGINIIKDIKLKPFSGIKSLAITLRQYLLFQNIFYQSNSRWILPEKANYFFPKSFD